MTRLPRGKLMVYLSPALNVMIAAARKAGLELVKREDFPPFVFLLVFGRAP